jgi:tRNA (mo5U34)-methyltransferase
MATGTAPRQDEFDTIPWFHRIDLGDGRTTPGVDQTPEKLAQVRLPRDLKGWSVLDIGAWDGFFSFEAERRGASRVVALDGGVWRVESIGKRGFLYARNALNSRVEDVELEVLDIAPETVGVFDLVLFLGVLYHLPHPLLALQRIASVTRTQLILETHVDVLESDRPLIAYYPGDECAGDQTNWCGPNRAAVEAMLRTVGFAEVKAFPATPATYKVRGAGTSRFGRMVFHAWK